MASWSRSALIVDDQPFVGMVAADILRETGFTSLHAFDAPEAIAVLRSHPEIQMLVTGANLTGPLDGVELARRVSRERPDIKIVVTAESLDLGSQVPKGTRVLRKPFASADLRALIPPVSLQHS